MSTLLLDSTVGLADVQRAALRQIFSTINGIIDEINAEKEAEDIEFETFMERTSPQATTVEHIAVQNFHEGHRPSLIKAPIDQYPNLCVWSVRATPSAESSQSDHTSIYTNLLYVEVMVKATPDEDEETVNRRIARTVDAAHIALFRDPTLGGKVPGMSSEPTVNLSDVFTRKERTSYGPHWYWQGARLEYAVRKDAAMPSSTPGSIFQAAVPGPQPVQSVRYEGLNIDQR